MTKQELIKEAWGNQYSNDVIMEGIRCGFKIVDNIEYAVNYQGGDWYCEPHTFETIAFMPKGLREYLNNNGWIKIESNEDLPKENGKYLTYRKNGIIIEEYFYLSHPYSWQNFYNVTHYQPIEKPKPPLY